MSPDRFRAKADPNSASARVPFDAPHRFKAAYLNQSI